MDDSNDLLTARAESIAARVDAAKTGFDPLTIITIITQVLPLIVGCFQRNETPKAEEVKARVVEMNAKNPEQLERRTARRIRAESDHPMSKPASFELARATIAECVESDNATVTAFCEQHAGA